MNLKLISSALLIAGLAAPAAFATSSGTITFQGKITNVTCSVDGNGTGKPDFTVDLGSISAGDFANVGDAVGPQAFQFKIGGEPSCTDGTKVWAKWSGTSFIDPQGLINVNGTAGGVKIRLFNKTGDKIDAFNNDDTVKETVVGNVATLVYAAAFERTANVTAGDASGLVNYTINFEAP